MRLASARPPTAPFAACCGGQRLQASAPCRQRATCSRSRAPLTVSAKKRQGGGGGGGGQQAPQSAAKQSPAVVAAAAAPGQQQQAQPSAYEVVQQQQQVGGDGAAGPVGPVGYSISGAQLQQLDLNNIDSLEFRGNELVLKLRDPSAPASNGSGSDSEDASDAHAAAVRGVATSSLLWLCCCCAAHLLVHLHAALPSCQCCRTCGPGVGPAGCCLRSTPARPPCFPAALLSLPAAPAPPPGDRRRRCVSHTLPPTRPCPPPPPPPGAAEAAGGGHGRGGQDLLHPHRAELLAALAGAQRQQQRRRANCVSCFHLRSHRTWRSDAQEAHVGHVQPGEGSWPVPSLGGRGAGNPDLPAEVYGAAHRSMSACAPCAALCLQLTLPPCLRTSPAPPPPPPPAAQAPVQQHLLWVCGAGGRAWAALPADQRALRRVLLPGGRPPLRYHLPVVLQPSSALWGGGEPASEGVSTGGPGSTRACTAAHLARNLRAYGRSR